MPQRPTPAAIPRASASLPRSAAASTVPPLPPRLRLAPALAAALLVLLSACAGAQQPHAMVDAAAAPAGNVATRARRPPASSDWLRGAVVYELFVRSFRDADGDGVGDLRGLTARLDYLNDGKPGGDDLGVDALWLMPVFASPSYHGYDTTDYEHVNDAYGSEADFDAFLAAAHARGMRVILDLVLNHTSDQHPWFVDSASGWGAARRQWYVWRGDDPGWTQPWGGSNHTWHPRNGAFYYGIFWSGMPDLNYANPEVRAEMERVAARWLSRGVDGFRLDAARHLFADGPGELQNDRPATHDMLRELAAKVRQAKPDGVLVGESWTEMPIIASYYGSHAVPVPDELTSCFDFPLAEQILAGVRDGDAAGIAAKIAEVQRLYPPGAVDAPFLTNHDQVRVATQLAGDPGRLRAAAAVLLTLPGAPFLYYGEELGMENGPGSGDEAKRTPMPWDASPDGGFTTATPWYPFGPGHEAVNVAAERHDPASLLAWYRRLIAARHGSAALRQGDLRLLPAGSQPAALLGFLRRSGKETVLVLHNLGGEPLTSEPLPYTPRQLRRPLLESDGASVVAEGKGRQARVALPAYGSAILRVQ